MNHKHSAIASIGLACSVFGADRALLIGVNHYQNEADIPRLMGCEDDARSMRHVLIAEFGFAEDQIMVLLSEQATARAILDAIDGLIRVTLPGDRVLIHFSGHGSQKRLAAPTEAEPDGFDELLCPYDFDPRTLRNAIVDNDLHERLAKLDGRNVVVIVDACHSGSVTRSIGDGEFAPVESIDSGQSVPRFIPPLAQVTGGARDIQYVPPRRYAMDDPTARSCDTIFEPGPALSRHQRFGDREIGESATYVAMSSCGDQEKSVEIRNPHNPRGRRGAFSCALEMGLLGEADANADGSISYRELLEYTNGRARSRLKVTQLAELHGNRALMERPFLSRSLCHGGQPTVIAVDGSRATVNRGWQHGFGKGQEFTVGDCEAGAKVKVAEAEQFLSTIAIPPHTQLKAGDRLIKRDIRYSPGEFSVWICIEGAEPKLETSVRKSVDALAGVKLAADAREADCILQVKRQDHLWRAAIFGPLGILKNSKTYAAEDDLLKGVENRVYGEAVICELERLAERSPPSAAMLKTLDGRDVYLLGMDRTIEFEFRGNAAFVSLLSVDSEGAVVVLIDNVRVKHDGENRLPPDGSCAFQISEPTGRDVIFAIATQMSVNWDELLKVKHEPAALSRAVWPGTPKDATGLAALPASGWGVASVEIETRR